MMRDSDLDDVKMSAEEFCDLCRTGTSWEIIAAIEAGADLQHRYLSALCEYMGRDDITPDADVINAMVEAGADMNADDADYMTPLMLAARNGALEAIAALIRNGAKVNARENAMFNLDPWTAWMYAAVRDNLEAKAILLRAGAEVSEEDVYAVWGHSCAHRAPWALAAMLRNREAAKWIAIDYARNPVLKNSDVFPQVWDVCLRLRLSGFEHDGSGISGRDFICLCALGTCRDIEAAIKSGADVNEQSRDMFDRRTVDPYRMTPLMAAAVYNDDPGVIRALIEAGADTEARYERERVVSKEYIDYANEFSEESCWVLDNALRRGNDLTALMLAVKSGAPEGVVSALIEGGACVNARSDYGNTPLAHAIGKYEDVLRYWDDVRSYWDDEHREILQTAAARTIHLLIEAGADVNARIQSSYSGDEGTVLMNAISLSVPAEIVAAMIGWGARVNYRSSSGKTALMIAVQVCALSLIEENRNNGDNTQPENNETASEAAVENGDSEFFSALRKAAADARGSVDKERQILLTLAAERGDPLVPMLLEAGADVSARNDEGMSAMDYAVYQYFVSESLGGSGTGTVSVYYDHRHPRRRRRYGPERYRRSHGI